MNIKQLTILKTLLATRSYTDTARTLNYTQSNISQRNPTARNRITK